MAKHRIEVILDDKEEKLIKYMMKNKIYGEVSTANEVLKRIFYLQLREDMDLMEGEIEENGNY